MYKKIFITGISAIFFLFCINNSFAQCGADGTGNCSSKSKQTSKQTTKSKTKTTDKKSSPVSSQPKTGSVSFVQPFVGLWKFKECRRSPKGDYYDVAEYSNGKLFPYFETLDVKPNGSVTVYYSAYYSDYIFRAYGKRITSRQEKVTMFEGNVEINARDKGFIVGDVKIENGNLVIYDPGDFYGNCYYELVKR